MSYCTVRIASVAILICLILNCLIQAGVHTSPVRTLRYGWLTYALGERTLPRLGKTSKIIAVDGNLASGKGALALKLAENLGRNVPKLFLQILQMWPINLMYRYNVNLL